MRQMIGTRLSCIAIRAGHDRRARAIVATCPRRGTTRTLL